MWFVDKVTGTVRGCVYLPGNQAALKFEAIAVIGDTLAPAA